eukprot:scaffold23106_cov30-Tisochrysis_lutea.AAC.5
METLSSHSLPIGDKTTTNASLLDANSSSVCGSDDNMRLHEPHRVATTAPLFCESRSHGLAPHAARTGAAVVEREVSPAHRWRPRRVRRGAGAGAPRRAKAAFMGLRGGCIESSDPSARKVTRTSASAACTCWAAMSARDFSAMAPSRASSS